MSILLWQVGIWEAFVKYCSDSRNFSFWTLLAYTGILPSSRIQDCCLVKDSLQNPQNQVLVEISNWALSSGRNWASPSNLVKKKSLVPWHHLQILRTIRRIMVMALGARPPITLPPQALPCRTVPRSRRSRERKRLETRRHRTVL